MTQDLSSWRRRAREVIQQVLASLPEESTLAAKRQALRPAYPFGERANHPYRMWLLEVRRALGVKYALPDSVRVSPAGITCSWCDNKGCLCCASACQRLEESGTDWERWQQWLDVLEAEPGDPVARLAFADWLEEQGWDEEAAHQRRQAQESGR